MHSAKKTAQEVRAHSFLALFSEEQAQQLAQAAEVRTYRDGERIFFEGDVADSLYLVLEGSVRLTKKDPAGNEQLLAVVGAHDYFGEFGVLDGHARSTGGLAAVSGTTLARLPQKLVSQAFNAAGAEGMMKIALHIIRKIRETNELVVTERLRKERMTLVGEMAEMIIHDLRNPFTVIQICVDMLRGEVPPPALEKCDLIDAQLQRSKEMVEELLEFSRGSTQLTRRPVDAAHLLAEFEKLFRDYLALSHVELTLKPVSRVIEVDASRMVRVLQNLVNNSIEAFDGRPGKIVIACQERDRVLLITVSDNGPGIPPEKQAAMFEPFGTLGKKQGFGLGMAIAKSIVTAHGGHLSAASKPGKGTRFVIELPLDAPPPPAAS